VIGLVKLYRNEYFLVRREQGSVTLRPYYTTAAYSFNRLGTTFARLVAHNARRVLYAYTR